MKTQSYHINIAGINYHITAPDKIRLNRNLKCFLMKIKNAPKSDVKISIKYEEKIPLPDNIISLDDHIKWATDKTGEVSICLSDENQVHSCLKTNKSWNNALILANGKERRMNSHLQGALGEILFRNSILYHEGIVIHAAAIACNNKGIIFSAPSGTGKTTQANLWKKYKGAKIINADRPAIRIVEEKPYIYGTLWNGSSKECTNTKVVLSMIVIVEQSPTNEIIRLSGKEAVAKVMPRCFLPYCTHESMDLALKNLERIIGITPVYLLKCRPDKEAVELVNQCMI
ncbi:MAG: hypothetical protein K0S61_4233 [Anaerocolumna sp.]|jgi:hypothetical protein|nr:hypothetical protein [Anaerocolumna sp.]